MGQPHFLSLLKLHNFRVPQLDHKCHLEVGCLTMQRGAGKGDLGWDLETRVLGPWFTL